MHPRMQCRLSVNIHDYCENCGDCWTIKQHKEYCEELELKAKRRKYGNNRNIINKISIQTRLWGIQPIRKVLEV